jgi:hypothetical protein
MTQGEGPEFKPQRQTKQNNKKPLYTYIFWANIFNLLYFTNQSPIALRQSSVSSLVGLFQVHRCCCCWAQRGWVSHRSHTVRLEKELRTI